MEIVMAGKDRWAFISCYRYGERYKAEITMNLHNNAEVSKDELFDIEMLEDSIICNSPEEVIKNFKDYFKGE